MVCAGGKSARHRNWSLPPSSTISTLGLLPPPRSPAGKEWKSSSFRPGTRFGLSSLSGRHCELSVKILSFRAGGSRLVNSKVALPTPRKLSFSSAIDMIHWYWSIPRSCRIKCELHNWWSPQTIGRRRGKGKRDPFEPFGAQIFCTRIKHRKGVTRARKGKKSQMLNFLKFSN